MGKNYSDSLHGSAEICSELFGGSRTVIDEAVDSGLEGGLEREDEHTRNSHL